MSRRAGSKAYGQSIGEGEDHVAVVAFHPHDDTGRRHVDVRFDRQAERADDRRLGLQLMGDETISPPELASRQMVPISRRLPGG